MSFAIGFLIFPDLQQLDFTAPYEAFASMSPKADIHLVWKTLDPVRSVTHLGFTPTTTLDRCPQLDLICVPGGVGVNALMQDPAVLTFLRRQAEGARFVTSVCTGAMVLAAAGLLEGRRATTHWLAHDLLGSLGAIPTAGRVVRDGKFITAGGVTAGLDFGLAVIADLHGPEAAEAVQLYLEYAPEPPFDSGTPMTAAPELVAAVRAASAASREARERIVAEIRAARGQR